MKTKNKGVPKTIRDIMSKNVGIVVPSALLSKVAQKMQKGNCGCVLVINGGRIVGIITERDLALRCVANEHDLADATAAQVMSSEILYCRDTDVADAVTKNMDENKVRRLAVLDADKRLVGMVTRGNLPPHAKHQLDGEIVEKICRVPAA